MNRIAIAGVLALVLGGCSLPNPYQPTSPAPTVPPVEGPPAVETQPAPTPPPVGEPEPLPAPVVREPVLSPASRALVGQAQTQLASKNYAVAASSIERALRIEPKNPRLWQEFARVRMKQGDYAQAENLAARSNSWAGADNNLRAENWRLIAEARTARGDDAGAKAALERAKQAER